MLIKNTPKGCRLTKKLSDYLRDATPYFRAIVDKGWNRGEDIRFEIASVGNDSPLVINTTYTPTNGFCFKVRILSNQVEDSMELIRLCHRLEDSERVLIHMKNMIEKVQPEPSNRTN